jgi:hypothetical protein
VLLKGKIMSELIEAKGACLCGAIQVSATAVTANVGACHCSMCRKWGGGPLLAVDAGAEVVFSGDQQPTTFTSSAWAERGFCGQCGTHLFYRLTEHNKYIMPVGLFDGDNPWLMDHQIFVDEKPDFYCFANDTKNMTGAEVFAEFSASAQ